MAYQKLQVSRALVVIPSDTVDIPFPGALMISSTTTGATTLLKLIDSAGDFINKGVRPGDIIYNYVSSEAATVTNVDSATQLSVTLAAGITTGNAYNLYKAGANEGCVLYVGTTGNVDLITAGGDTVLYTGVPAGMFMPVQVKRVKATLTTAATIVAQW